MPGWDGAAAAGYLTPIQGAELQEFIDLLSTLNSLRMIQREGCYPLPMRP